MASLSKDKNGTKRIMFMDPTGKRRTIRLGKINVKTAEAFLMRVERLIDASRTGTSLDAQTTQWLSELPDDTFNKLVAVDLAKPRKAESKHTLGELLEEYFATLSVKDSTRTRYMQTRRLLLELIGSGRSLESISPRDADQWRADIVAKGYADAKVSKEVSIARMFFKQAVRWELITSNPFEGVKAGSQTNRDRLFYLKPEDAHKLIDAAPSSDWRCIIALARFGGLRCPSEVLGVRWGDVDWANNRLRVRSPKTERHLGKAERVIPLFPELREVLIDAFDLAPEGAEFVVNQYRDASVNLRTQMNRIIERAGMVAWPRLFNALRASRATELAAQYPAAVCTAWMGHTQAVAEAHYHMVRDEDFAKAATTPASGTDGMSGSESGANCGALVSQNASQQQTATTGNTSENGAQIDKGPAFMPVPSSRCHSLQNRSNGPGQTRTVDLTVISGAL
tara:strand:- start:39674 stop:41029 length:1356 start_codon:yes stop_codon:yes gene_type:complete